MTGASSGIGLEVAKLISEKAENVAISARSADKLKDTAAEFSTISAYTLDVTDAKATAKTISEIEDANGAIDLAILNAGTWQHMKVNDLDMAPVRSAVEVNYMGVMNAIDALLPGMLARGVGHIAIVGSVAGYRGLPGAIAYGPTKAALINLAETMNAELGPKGIRISIINPGFVDTPMTEVNEFRMPGMISAVRAAQIIVRGLEKGKYEIVFPTLFGIGMKMLRLMPNWLFFQIARRMAP